MNETFCTDVSDCSAFECNDFLCWDGLVLRPNISQETTVFLYIAFRIAERVIFAYLDQVNRVLLQMTINERKESTSCCFKKGVFPTGIYWQVLLRFLGTFIGVAAFILILERNIWMFISLILIDSLGVGLISLKQHRDAYTTHGDLTMKVDAVNSDVIDAEWLANMKKYLEATQGQIPETTEQGLQLKFL